MTLRSVSQSEIPGAGGDPEAGQDALLGVFERVYAMTGAEARVLASRCRLRLLSEGGSIVEEGKPATAVHWIVVGRAAVSRYTPREGRLALVDLMPGEVVGDIAFLRQDPDAVYSATVQAR